MSFQLCLNAFFHSPFSWDSVNKLSCCSLGIFSQFPHFPRHFHDLPELIIIILFSKLVRLIIHLSFMLYIIPLFLLFNVIFFRVREQCFHKVVNKPFSSEINCISLKILISVSVSFCVYVCVTHRNL